MVFAINGGLICFGGVCVPVNAIWPLVLLGLKWVYERCATPVRCVARRASRERGRIRRAQATAGPRAARAVRRARRPAGRGAARGALRRARFPGARARGSAPARDRDPRRPARRSTEDWDARVRATAGGGRVLVVDFTATWCKPCQKVYPFYKRLAATFAAAGDFVKVDVDDLDDVAERAKVTAMPTFQVYAGGALAGACTGARESDLRALVEAHCGKKDA